MVKYLPHILRVEGSSPATAAGTGSEKKMFGSAFAYIFRIFYETVKLIIEISSTILQTMQQISNHSKNGSQFTS